MFYKLAQQEEQTAQAQLTIGRRDFIKVSGVAGVGLMLGISAPVSADEAGPGEAGASDLKDGDIKMHAFIRIDPDNTVTVMMKHLEMGQGSYTGLATLVADEMDADWEQMRAEGAAANAALYNNLAWGPVQGTGGSTALPNSFLQMRKAGAAARTMLVNAAAELWEVPAQEVTVAMGVVSHASSNRTASFGELAEAAMQQPVPADVTLKSAEQFTYIGKNNLRRLDSDVKSKGQAQYTQDVQLPDMLTAVVAHAPLFGATVKSFDDSAAKEVPGVKAVVQIPTGVAVLAHDFWSAKKGRDALKVEWDDSKASKVDSADQMARYKAMAEEAGLTAHKTGEGAAALEKASKTISAGYEFPYLAHATMEPMNCVVHIHDEGCEIWNGCQIQTVDQGNVAHLLGLKPEQVKINMLYAGGSFGRRANPLADYVLEAANIAKASGLKQPIKMVWTREDDMKAGYYRPSFYHKLQAGLDENGELMAWSQHVVGQSILEGTPFAGMIQNNIDVTSVEGSGEPYEIANVQVDLHTAAGEGVPVQWWRSVGHTHTAFATECFLDEVAEAAGKDPLELRRSLLQEHPRHLNVLNLAAEKAGWGSDMGENRGRGIAVVKSFNSYVAQVAEVTVNEDKSFSVDRVVVAVDCGLPVNPDVIYAQVSGALGYGLSAALSEEIILKEGRVEQSNFHNYQVLRMLQMPKVEVHIVRSTENPTGIGEPGLPPIAPAVANALAQATKKRVYQLPMGTKVA